MGKIPGIVRVVLIIGFLVISSFGNAYGAKGTLRMVIIESTSPMAVQKAVKMGLDIATIRKEKNAKGVLIYKIEAVVSPSVILKLNKIGLKCKELPKKKIMKTDKATVYKSFDEEGGIKDQLYELAAQYPKLVKLKVIGKTIQDRPIIAMCLSKKGGFGKLKHIFKPEMLYLATHHAREWVAAEMGMRLIKYYLSNYGTDTRVTNILDTKKIWIIPLANPDGYEYTHTTERLWRKNLRDNDKDGKITNLDGVDLNRNFGGHFGLDDEGSSPEWSSQTYRGEEAFSEPETKAVVKFIRKRRLKSIISYHTYSNLILYPWGWQVKTKSFDHGIFVAQAGTTENPAIIDTINNVGYEPQISADLYPTNGDFTDWSYSKYGIPSYTVELTKGVTSDGEVYGFEFPDDEALLQTVFEDNLEFALCAAESAADQSKPVSPVGIETNDIYHTQISESWGKNQDILINGRIGKIFLLKYKINDGFYRYTPFLPALGKKYNTKHGKYYTGLKAKVRGQKDGDKVTYTILNNFKPEGEYSYTVKNATGNRVLIIAAEDYSGQYPEYDPADRPHYLSYYTNALKTAGYSYDVWNVDEQKAAPDYNEVLAHYDAVIWYTGDDYAPTVPGFEVHQDIVLNLRDYQNYYNGKVLATGQDISWLSSVNGSFSDDYFQYYLGAYIHIEKGGINTETGIPYGIVGEENDPVLGGISFDLNGGDGANNQLRNDTFITTGSILSTYESEISAKYNYAGGPFSPHSGEFYVYSQKMDMSYKRLGGVFTISGDDPFLKFWISYDIETNWDFAFVEISEQGSNIWTTLPDVNGLTTTDTGESCASGWVDIHPFLANYLDENCNPSGTTGNWNAFTGSSGGWKQVKMDLSAYAGKTVELYITYASDWGSQNLGTFIDDIEVPGYPLQDFEQGLGDFSISSAEGSTALNNWKLIEGSDFIEGPVIRTKDSVYMGFGLEAVASDETRAQIIKRVMTYFNM
ncbi:MAG: zinc carboxypeptidase [Desulfobacterales bacterium]|nr:zinc carboxypeptidase [Desulfobacterales bacterium]MCP4162203.1 zinc carboxypeptidase [Deltaproteobacteria bacterium]